MIVGPKDENLTSSISEKQDLNETIGKGYALSRDDNRALVSDPRTGKPIYTMGQMMEGLEDDDILRSHTAIVLENMRQQVQETTKLVNIGDFEKYAFPMVRSIFPNLAAHNLASVQPMLGPVSLVFFMKFTYGLTKGLASVGQDIIENPNQHYSSEHIDEELVDTGDGATTTLGSGTLDFVPVNPGTFVMTTEIGAAPAEITDDGNGALIGDIGGGTNTIDYATGTLVVDWSAAPDLAAPIVAAYDYDIEANDNVPAVDMQLTSSPVIAKTRKLRTRWSLEAAQDLRNLHGLMN